MSMGLRAVNDTDTCQSWWTATTRKLTNGFSLENGAAPELRANRKLFRARSPLAGSVKFCSELAADCGRVTARSEVLQAI